jgi:hypothetical protein
LDPDKMKAALASRWTFLWSLNLANYEEAFRKMREFGGKLK